MDASPFPRDLVQAQTAWYATYRELAYTPATHGTAAHRRRLQELSRLIAAHPYWQTPHGTPAARMALKELARQRAHS
ncbi:MULTISPECIES: hypothetical protein [unclassified Streptomyces]|uniref:hypothetical protein n=1 Tax=unclassified Streptomyces TaxID=2593676 RepID=UPI0011CE1981|nr:MULTISPECIES: hypothetical protein [unclassified Streptomyces]TXS70120.1 hypothetical protein EAO69_25020 [Streptomyces sp. me109]